MYHKARECIQNTLFALPFGMGDFLRESEFTQNMLKLTTAGGIVAGIAFCLTPINTRLFSPSDYGLFNVVCILSNLGGVLLCFNLSPIILIEKRERAACAAASLAILLLPISVAVTGLIFYFYGTEILAFFNAKAVSGVIPWVIGLLFVNGLAGIWGQWILRKKMFGLLGKQSIFSSLFTNAIRLPWGYVSPSFWGLYAAQFIPTLVVTLWNIARFKIKWTRSFKRLRWAFRKNFTFMVYQTANNVVGAIGTFMPNFCIIRYCGADALGIYTIAMLLIDVPVNLIVNSFQTVYYKRVADTVAAQPEELLGLYLRNTKKIVLIGIFPIIGVGSISFFLPFILGEQWREAVPILQLLLFWRFMRFVTAPAYAILTVLRKNYILLLTQILAFLCVGIGLYFAEPILFSIVLYALLGSIPYWGILLLLTWLTLKQNQRHLHE